MSQIRVYVHYQAQGQKRRQKIKIRTKFGTNLVVT